MTSGNLITVSYRLPYSFTAPRKKLQATPSAGGLATALTSYFSLKENAGRNSNFKSLHWLGVSDLSQATFLKVSDQEVIQKDGIHLHSLFLREGMKDKFYNGFCNSTLWPLFLYFPSFVSYEQSHYDNYIEANHLMCEKVVQLYQQGDTIWIHDYHWMLLPGLLREALPDASIGFFLHIPFPNFELFRLLPRTWRTALLSGLLGADVIGLQTQEFANYLLECMQYVFPNAITEGNRVLLTNRSVTIDHYPISIDFKKFNSLSKMPITQVAVKKIRKRVGQVKIILSVDRLDYTKALFSRLESFALFLEQNGNYHEKVSYVLLMVPSRESILKYKENKLAIEALVSRINGQYGRFGWTPILYQYQRIDFPQLVALYGAADIALIVSSRDGMNLVAKEYVASRSESNGVLILSETAGSSGELTDAIQVNANDRQEIANAIVSALQMSPAEQSRRIHRMQDHIKTHDVTYWAEKLFNSIATKEQIKFNS